MNDTNFWLNTDDVNRWARPYRKAANGVFEKTEIPYFYGTEATDRSRAPLGGAGLLSTAEDIAKLYRMLLNGGSANGVRVINSATLDEMRSLQTGKLETRPGMCWGLGFCLVADPSKLEANSDMGIGSFGHGGAFGTQSWADPKNGVIYVFLTQRRSIPGNPDNFEPRRAYQHAVAASMGTAK